MINVIDNIHGNPSSIHADGRAARAIIEKSRKTIASIINSSVSEIFFTSGGTESNNMVLIGCVRDLAVKRIISSPVEHHCILHTLDYLNTHSDVQIVFIPVNKFGAPDLNALEEELKKSSELTLVTLMHVNNELGTVTDISKAASICKEHSAMFHSDTTQSIGLLPIDVQSQGIDFLTGSAHKFHGPKGVGFVYISNKYPIKSYIHGGSQERNMRAGTENLVGIAGMSSALEKTWSDREIIHEYVDTLRNQLKTGILEIFQDAYVNGDPEQYSSKILSVSFPPSDKNEMVLLSLDIHGISASGGSACSSGIEHTSGVLDYINEPSDRKTIRFSFSKYNNQNEVETCLEKLAQIFEAKKAFS